MKKGILLAIVVFGIFDNGDFANASPFRDVYIQAYSCYYSTEPLRSTCIDPGVITPIPNTPDGIVHPFDIYGRNVSSISADRDIIWNEPAFFETMLTPAVTMTAGRNITLVQNPTAITVPGPLIGTLTLTAGGSVSGVLNGFFSSVNPIHNLIHEDVFVTAPTASLTTNTPSTITIHTDKTPAQKALYDFYNNYIIPVSNELNAIALDLTKIGAGMSAIGAGLLLTPAAPVGYDLLLMEAELLADGSFKALGGFKKDLPPLKDPPITLPTLTPQGPITTEILADFNTLLQGEAQLVSGASALNALVQQLRTALANNDFQTAASLEVKIQDALAALGSLSGAQHPIHHAVKRDC
jgi:hypothetical protein